MVKKKKARVSDETFDEFLAEQGMLGPCEERAIKEIVAEQLSQDGIPGPDTAIGTNQINRASLLMSVVRG